MDDEPTGYKEQEGGGGDYNRYASKAEWSLDSGLALCIDE